MGADHDHMDPEIAREHKAINATLHRLEHATDPHSLQPLLEGLRNLLESHFEREEEADGLHASIARNALDLLPGLDALFAEHREISSSLEQLLEQSEGLSKLAAELSDGTHRLVERLRAHEAQENSLFVHAIYDVHGVGD